MTKIITMSALISALNVAEFNTTIESTGKTRNALRRSL